MITISAEAGFQAGQSAAAADSSLKNAIREMDGAKHRAVLWFADIMKRRLYRRLGYSNMPQYATSELNFSKTRTGDFLRMARKLEELPAVKKSLADGDLGYTKVVEIIKVATPVTEKHWVSEAAQTGRRELAKKVKRVQAKARLRQTDKGQGSLLNESPTERKLAAETPVRVTLELTPEQYARFETLMEKIRKVGSAPSAANRVDILLAALDELAQGTLKPIKDCGETASATPTRRRVFSAPFQVHVHRCPKCGKSSVQTSRGELEMHEADTKRAACDANIKQPGKHNTATIAPGRRSDVLRRDRFRCRAPGCRNSRFLEVHHVQPKSRGGGNDLGNLVTLCSGCHRLHHEGRLRI